MRPRCRFCGEVIGVYEPLVLRTAEGERETSLAADPSIGPDAVCLHIACAVPEPGPLGD